MFTGSARDGLIARSKIVLNLHFYESRVFEIVGVSYLLANRKCVVSEAGSDSRFESQFVPGFAFVPYHKLAETCLQLLQDPVKRDALARSGFDRIVSLSQTEYLREALRALPP